MMNANEIIYYESVDKKIAVTDQYVYVFRGKYKIEDLQSGQGVLMKPDQTLNIAIAIIGIVCIILGKLRAGQLSQIFDLNVFFNATNYFDLTGLVLILITLLMTLPQTEQYAIRLKHRNGNQVDIILKDKKYYREIREIDRAIKQSIRYAEFKRKIS